MKIIELIEKDLGWQLSPVQKVMLVIKLLVESAEVKIISPSGGWRDNKTKSEDDL